MPAGVFQVSRTRNRLTLGATSGTVTVDLPTANYLQGVNIRVQNTNGSTSNTGETIESQVSKIEIIADGTVVYTMNGEMCRKFEQFDTGQLPPSNEDQTASAVQWAIFPIKFGRDDFDKEVILPAHLFSSLQLKLTWSFTDSATAGYTTSATNAIMDVLSRYLVSNERVSTPFLKKLEVYSKSTTATGTEEVDLPTGSGAGAYRRIMFHVYEAAIQDGVDVDLFEVLVNDAQRIVDERWDTSQAEDAIRYGCRTKKGLTVYKSSNQTYASKVSNLQTVSANARCCGNLVHVNAVAGDTLTFDLRVAGSNASAADVIYLQVEGPGAAYATMMDFGTDRLSDSLNVSPGSGVSTLKLKYNVAATGSTNRVVTEQLVAF